MTPIIWGAYTCNKPNLISELRTIPGYSDHDYVVVDSSFEAVYAKKQSRRIYLRDKGQLHSDPGSEAQIRQQQVCSVFTRYKDCPDWNWNHTYHVLDHCPMLKKVPKSCCWRLILAYQHCQMK